MEEKGPPPETPVSKKRSKLFSTIPKKGGQHLGSPKGAPRTRKARNPAYCLREMVCRDFWCRSEKGQERAKRRAHNVKRAEKRVQVYANPESKNALQEGGFAPIIDATAQRKTLGPYRVDGGIEEKARSVRKACSIMNRGLPTGRILQDRRSLQLGN